MLPSLQRLSFPGTLCIAWLSAVCALGCLSWSAASSPAAADEVDFATTIQPLLAKRCFSCHGPDKQEGGFRLDKRETTLAEADSGSAPIVPGDSSHSELVRRILSTDDAERMPPEGAPLKTEQIDALRKWIDEGAHYAPHWAFRPVERPEVAEFDSGDALAQPLDVFIARRLKTKQLTLSPEATPAELIRRVYLDTLGLPPPPDEVARLTANWSEATYAQLVDRLLADPAMGDRWGRHWLDVVRYAETNSFERDGVKPNAWKYRDYVILSINDDKPYDQFIREQIAGDELDEVTTETLTATGFYRLGIWDDEPADPLQARFDEYDDIVSTLGQAFLALTFNCARCHDHKIDPIPQRDYYGLVAFVRDVTSYGARGDQSMNSQIDVSGQQISARYDQLNAQIRELSKQLRKIEQDAIVQMPAPDQRATEGPEREKVLKAKLKTYLTDPQREEYDSAQQARRELQRELDALPQRQSVLGLAKCDRAPPATHVLLRGSPHNPGSEVQPSFPTLLGGDTPALPAPPAGAKTAGRRRVLADWLASKDNWLTARVMANRIWQHYFGRGIAPSPNNFGLMGERATHPELLDYLATQLMDHNWSLKALHRQILLSSTYRQSSAIRRAAAEIDPDNQLFWRQSLRRLSAEQVRDSVLAVTGQLNEEQFGPSFYQSLSQEVLASQSRPGSGWGQSSPAQQARRSVYIHVKRSLPVPMLSAFDFPETDISCEARFLTTQPGQALGMLNSQWMQEQAAVLESVVQREVGDNLHAHAARTLERVLSQPASARDVEELVQLAQRLVHSHNFTDQQARRAMCLAALNLNQFLYID